MAGHTGHGLNFLLIAQRIYYYLGGNACFQRYHSFVQGVGVGIVKLLEMVNFDTIELESLYLSFWAYPQLHVLLYCVIGYMHILQFNGRTVI
jgi:hypothetical protein